jgi:hypothetical protein
MAADDNDDDAAVVEWVAGPITCKKPWGLIQGDEDEDACSRESQGVQVSTATEGTKVNYLVFMNGTENQVNWG